MHWSFPESNNRVQFGLTEPNSVRVNRFITTSASIANCSQENYIHYYNDDDQKNEFILNSRALLQSRRVDTNNIALALWDQ